MPDSTGDKIMSNLYQVLIDLGYTPEIPISREDAKKELISRFTPYFSNQVLLEHIAELTLPANKIQLEVISTVPWALELFEQSLKTHNDAKEVDLKGSIEIASEWLSIIYPRAAFTLNVDLVDKEPEGDALYDFAAGCREAIGNITDGMQGPLCKELLQQIRLGQRQKRTLIQMQSLEFGDVVNQLSTLTSYGKHLTPEPWGIGIHVWRNIADHRMMSVKDGNIVCKLGKADAGELVLSPMKLRDVVVTLLHVMLALHLAHRIFYLDNVETKVKLGTPKPDLQVTNRAKRINFAAAIAHLGFSVTDYQEKGDLTYAQIRDLTNDDPQSREFQILSIAQMLWQLTRAPKVEIHYIESNGQPRVGVQVAGKAFTRFASGLITTPQLFEHSTFLNLRAQ